MTKIYCCIFECIYEKNGACTANDIAIGEAKKCETCTMAKTPHAGGSLAEYRYRD